MLVYLLIDLWPQLGHVPEGLWANRACVSARLRNRWDFSNWRVSEGHEMILRVSEGYEMILEVQMAKKSGLICAYR